jgi:hypothetical protein
MIINEHTDIAHNLLAFRQGVLVGRIIEIDTERGLVLRLSPDDAHRIVDTLSEYTFSFGKL